MILYLGYMAYSNWSVAAHCFGLLGFPGKLSTLAPQLAVRFVKPWSRTKIPVPKRSALRVCIIYIVNTNANFECEYFLKLAI